MHNDYLDQDKHTNHPYDDSEFCAVCESDIDGNFTGKDGKQICSQCHKKLILEFSTKACSEFSKESDSNSVNRPTHYTSHPSGVECIQVTQHLNFCLGNAMKYIWRCDDKSKPIEDLQKAIWYLQQEIKRRKA